MLRLRKLALVACCTLVLTGCPTPPKRVARPLLIEAPTPAGPTADMAATNSAKASPQRDTESAPASAATNLAWIATNGWVSLSAWTRALNGAVTLQSRGGSPSGVYEVRSSNGVLSLSAGSRVAYWNGLGLNLGFAPRAANPSDVAIHALDILKNFQPLMVAESFNHASRVVVIDPGHGGEDKGARCIVNGGYEKDYTLDWALRVQRLLAGNGWKVVLTRSKDIDLSLAERVAIAEEARADLFVSLHFNSVDPKLARPDHNGLETYCLTPAGMPSNLLRNFADDSSAVFPNNTFDAQNLRYAMRFHQAMVQWTQRRDRGVRRARFMGVLRGQNRPAVLLEGGYLSDPEEARLIASADYRQKLALAVAKVLMD